MDDPYKRPTFGTAVFYRNPMAALEWLARAFGFERSMLITDKDGTLAHSEMTYGNGYIMIGSEMDERAAPASLGGKTTQILHVRIPSGIDAHFATAKAAGAVVVYDLADQFYGDRSYTVKDPEGHHWSFAQPGKYVSREDAEKASGLKIEGWV